MGACIESFVIYEITLVSNLPSFGSSNQTHPLACTTYESGLLRLPSSGVNAYL